MYSIVSMAILVNGSSTQEFFPQKGLRQGEPLSPFLFNVIAEALNILMERAMEEGLIRDIKVGRNGILVSHLQFADDTIFRYFQLMSGLEVNYSKSMLCGVKVNGDFVGGNGPGCWLL